MLPPRRLLVAVGTIASVLVPAADAGAHLTPLTWTRLRPTYPMGNVEEVQGGSAGGLLYLFGGYNTTGARTGAAAGPLDPLPYAFAFDPATGAFTPLPGLNTWPVDQPFTHAGTTTDGGSFYFVGGDVLRQPGNASAGMLYGTRRVYRYDIAQQQYVRLPDLPYPRAAGAAVVLPARHELHFFGGIDPDSQRTGVDHRDHWVLNLAGGTTWTEGTPVPPDPDHPSWGINHVGSTSYGGRIYLFGGQHLVLTKLVTTPRAWCFDPASNSWTRLHDLPEPRSHMASTTFAVGDDILVLGGEIHHDRADALNDATVYSPASDQWEENTELPRKNLVSGVAGLIDGDVYESTGSYSSTTYRGTFAGG